MTSWKDEAENVKHLLQFLRRDTPEMLRNSAIVKLKSVSEDHLHLLMQPIDKAYWDHAALVLSSMEERRLRKCIPHLLRWIQDMNWPGANVIANKLVEMGESVLPHVKTILRGNDEVWIYWVLSRVVQQWSPELVDACKGELMALSKKRSAEEIDLIAGAILREHDLLP